MDLVEKTEYVSPLYLMKIEKDESGGARLHDSKDTLSEWIVENSLTRNVNEYLLIDGDVIFSVNLHHVPDSGERYRRRIEVTHPKSKIFPKNFEEKLKELNYTTSWRYVTR